MKTNLTPDALSHSVARASGVTRADTKITAAEKAVAVMKQFGFPEKDIRKAERLIEAAKKRGVV